MVNVIPPEVPGPVAGQAGHFPHHDWLTASVKALDGNIPPAWTTWTPTLTGSTGNPTLGTGAVQSGRKCRIGSLVVCQAFVQYGTSGIVAGSGVMRFGLPHTMKEMPTGAGDMALGSLLARDSSASLALLATFRPNTAAGLAYASAIYTAAYPTGALTAVSFTAPWVPAAGDSYGWSMVYETGDP